MNSKILVWALVLLLAFPAGGTAEEIFDGDMRVVNCSSYVSLREKRSTASARIAKVPLGAEVLAYPEEEQNGFVLCVYGEQYGYILKEYLEPISTEPETTEETAAGEE